MSVDTPPEPDRSPVLRREALLPNERSRGLGTVAVVCTMAGVASGLALATTLMAMQVADSMSVRSCPYREVQVQNVDMRSDHGFLGIRYVYREGGAQIDSVLPGTPAEDIGLVRGDRLLSIDGSPVRSDADVQQIANMQPGTQPTLIVEHAGSIETLHPTLTAWPAVRY
jgi:C-terminal processing protease CtpA/Prc